MLFDNFLKQYIQDVIECAFDEYNVPQEDIETIINNIENNEYVWQVLDEAVFQEIEKYKVMEGE